MKNVIRRYSTIFLALALGIAMFLPTTLAISSDTPADEVVSVDSGDFGVLTSDMPSANYEKVPVGEVIDVSIDDLAKSSMSSTSKSTSANTRKKVEYDVSEIRMISGSPTISDIAASVGTNALVVTSIATDFEIEDVITTNDTAQPYGYVALNPGEIVQIGLECPSSTNLDYDLWLGEYDPNDGNIYLLDTSLYGTYFNGARTLDEGIDWTNNSTYTQYLVIFVHSKVGSGAMFPYTLYFSIDSASNCNGGEMDQNAKDPCYQMQPGYSLNNVVMNSSSDVDWFEFMVSQHPGYEYYTVNLTAGNNKVEVFQLLSNDQLKLVAPTSGSTYKFTPNSNQMYYIKVCAADRHSFSANVYSLNCSVTSAPTVAYQLSITGYDSKHGNVHGYFDYGYGNWWSFDPPWLTVIGTAKDMWGSPVGAGQKLDIKFTNEYWAGPGGNNSLAYYSTTGTTSSNGTYSITLNNVGAAAGLSFSWRSSWGNLYFFDFANVRVTAQASGAYYQEPISHFAFAY